MNLNTLPMRSSCVRAVLVAVAALAVGCSPPPGGADEAITQGLNLDAGQDTDLFGSDGGRWIRTACPGGGGGTCVVWVTLPLVRHDAQGKGRLERIFVWSGDWIDGIRFAWRGPDGLIESPVAGTAKDGHLREPLIFEADEFIVRIEGRHGKYVDRLQITTNKRTYPAWGGGGGQPFDVDLRGSGVGEQIHGFQTRSGKFLDQIGFIVYPD